MKSVPLLYKEVQSNMDIFHVHLKARKESFQLFVPFILNSICIVLSWLTEHFCAIDFIFYNLMQLHTPIWGIFYDVFYFIILFCIKKKLQVWPKCLFWNHSISIYKIPDVFKTDNRFALIAAVTVARSTRPVLCFLTPCQRWSFEPFWMLM